MCRKYQRHCDELEALADQALQEWAGAETLEAVRACWGRKGGRTTAHRYGRLHFRLLALHRHGDPAALPLLYARMQRRRKAASR
jgi:hypothetical protein